jgi:hypothetical protein
MKTFHIAMLTATALALGACSSDTVEGDGDLFRRGAFEETVDGQRMVFMPSEDNPEEVVFTWDRINQNYINNDITSSTKYSGEITVPATVTHEGRQYRVRGVDDYSFFYCSKLTGITVSEGVEHWGDHQLVRSNNITKLILPSTIKNMKEVPYAYCAKFGKLKTVQLPPVEAIGDSAFCSCIALTGLTLPEGCRRLGRYALARANKLTTLTLPSTMEEIGEKCFASCSKLLELHVRAQAPPRMASDFDNAPNATLYVPKGAGAAYQADEKWGQFLNVIEE